MDCYLFALRETDLASQITSATCPVSFEMYDVENYVRCAETTTQIWNCNWKVAWDNYMENYHIPIGHPGLNRLLNVDDDTGESLSSGVDYGILTLEVEAVEG